MQARKFLHAGRMAPVGDRVKRLWTKSSTRALQRCGLGTFVSPSVMSVTVWRETGRGPSQRESPTETRTGKGDVYSKVEIVRHARQSNGRWADGLIFFESIRCWPSTSGPTRLHSPSVPSDCIVIQHLVGLSPKAAPLVHSLRRKVAHLDHQRHLVPRPLEPPDRPQHNPDQPRGHALSPPRRHREQLAHLCVERVDIQDCIRDRLHPGCVVQHDKHVGVSLRHQRRQLIPPARPFVPVSLLYPHKLPHNVLPLPGGTRTALDCVVVVLVDDDVFLLPLPSIPQHH
mmetsp:Transcript_15168/g.43158  ORF Transcript_15168/g.43158 Transcript_15168/m.43158 type:complete len:286 (+) Transcript_15168:184-1041(+)